MNNNNQHIMAFEPNTKESANRGEISPCWHTSERWDEQRVNSIVDPAGAHVNRDITSYPSPIARMHLTNDAFEFYLTNEESQMGEKYEKIISDCLDVWEIMFYFNIYRGRLDFSYWDFSQIDTLRKSKYNGHQLLADSLDLFLKGGEASDPFSSFSAVNGIYILTFQNKILAGSSPFTGFFTAPSLDGFSIERPGNAGGQYFTKIRHLPERDPEFQKYMHIIARSQNISDHFGNLFAYISRFQDQDEDISKIWTGQISVLKEEYERSYDLIREPVVVRLLDKSEEGGFELRSFQLKVEEDCFFIINTPSLKSRKILAFKTKPEGPSVKKMVTGIFWDDTYEVEAYPSDPWMERNFLGIKQPWVTIIDFFEDYIVRLPYQLNNEAFVTGTIDGEPSQFLLPLKPLALEFFSPEEIRKNFTLTITEGPSGQWIKATLLIPVQGNTHLSFTREYEKPDQATMPWPEEMRKNNDIRGFILDYQLALWLYPFLRTEKKEYNNFYRVGIIDNNTQNQGREPEMASLTLYQNGRAIQEGANFDANNVVKKTRVVKDLVHAGSEYYALNGSGEVTFDSIGVQTKIAGISVSAMVLPNWTKAMVEISEKDSYAFAADFGTTNTYVAYKKGTGEPRPFSVDMADMPIARLDKTLSVKPGISETERFDHIPERIDDIAGIKDETRARSILQKQRERQRHEFIPSIIGEKGGKYKFPIRTAISQAANVNTEIDLLLLANTNIAFALNQSLGGRMNERIFTDLKWGTGLFTKQQVKLFIEELLLMIRTKVLMNGGDPSKAKLYWFAPLSMSENLKDRMKEVWDNSYQSIFDTRKNPTLLTESQAPFFKMKNEGLFGRESALTIDIGGGTTDVIVYEREEIKVATSFSFAGNSLFGDFNMANLKNNGIIKIFKKEALRVIDGLKKKAENDQREKNRIDDIEDSLNGYWNDDSGMKSEDIASFFFSEKDLNFSEYLKEPSEFKFVFLLFFVSIQYHCARIIKEKGVAVPKQVCLSGNGSKIASLVSTDKSKLEGLIKAVFQEVVGGDIPKIKLIIEKEPKEVTCYGALYLNDKGEEDLRVEQVHYHLGENLIWARETERKTFKDLEEAKFDLPNSEYLLFHKLFFKLYEQEQFAERFGVKVKNLKDLKQFMLDNASTNFGKGVSFQAERGIEKTDELKETVFFYSITGLIYDLLNQFAFVRLGKSEDA